jgi:biopolymer transport protein ExbB
LQIAFHDYLAARFKQACGSESSIRRGVRVVEGARLESVYAPKGYRGFESLPLRYYICKNQESIYNPIQTIMKKVFSIIALIGMLNLSLFSVVHAQDDATESATEEVQTQAPASTSDDSVGGLTEVKEVTGFHQSVKKYFIEGDPTFMSFVLICLILGLALCIERILYLNMSTTNNKKLLDQIEAALNKGGVAAAKEVCRNTRGPVAAIFFQGLERSDDGIEHVEKSIESYGSIQMGLLERGLSWISLFIAIAPMLGFMGTVFGMIVAFDKIAAANTINAALVADGIKLALITTVSGLIVAIVLQIFYNYILAKIDGIVIDMEDASIALVDMLYKKQLKG